MDIISHTLTGVAVGTVASAFSSERWLNKITIILVGAFGGALPDLDAISLWSKFDSTIGKALNLANSGRQIYGGKLWYSHHAAFHSIIMPISLSLLFILVTSITNKYSTLSEFKTHCCKHHLKYSAFCFGFIFHLLEDMPTPASAWGGVNFFFPSSNYIGGFGKIWWWNNYDLVLIIFAVILINIGLNFINNTKKKTIIKLAFTSFLVGTLLFLYQINNRPYSFKYSGDTTKYNEYEHQSKQIQKDILGNKLYYIMVEIDNSIPWYF